MRAALALEDGTYVEGRAFGAEKDALGEIVFCTSMTGYVEALTDPSYKGQILMMTYPLIGNYGVTREDFESDGVKVEGFVVRELCKHPSNWRSEMSVDELLKEYNVPGIEGVDTRMLTRKIRIYGSMKAAIGVGDVEREDLVKKAVEQPFISDIDLVDKVCVQEPKRLDAKGNLEVVLIDCGVKMSIVRQLMKRGVNVTLVPYDYPADKIMEMNPDGVFISNGPGDPARVKPAIETIKSLAGKLPMAGICLGHQLTSIALGAKTFKLKFGHHGSNQPVKDFETGRVFISSQNHNFAVDEKTLPKNIEVTQINLNDNTVEGLVHKDIPLITVQYHPEAGPGPHDTYFFFDRFVEMVKEYR
ncbi:MULTISPECIES: glutamine-hydrolyzing carbamoyl-phosphate synthase small subunit [unclassified Archaeoglobus]|jgi:carbamoyl-phosphate synthase small subunit|uniref:glutamine-hydrolyzing carbamoyl-phosphate synthase small subunit n=1 Tax=unclassified Archaeoglobus TaxID=2643606 RepID=UPI0025C7119E|nr:MULTISPECIES: glutamine-hydrolyzing carbamoyl-phosphate synthase small subunit [unclassified Archaeoglobus]